MKVNDTERIAHYIVTDDKGKNHLFIEENCLLIHRDQAEANGYGFESPGEMEEVAIDLLASASEWRAKKDLARTDRSYDIKLAKFKRRPTFLGMLSLWAAGRGSSIKRIFKR